MKRLLPLLLLTFACSALAQGVRTAQYGQAATFDFYILDAAGLFDVNETDGGTDVLIMKDEGTPANPAADFVPEGTAYSIALNATEMSAARIEVKVAGEISNGFFIETYGCPLAHDPRGVKFCGLTAAGSTTGTVNLGAAVTSSNIWNGMIFYDITTNERAAICLTTNNGTADSISVLGLNVAPGTGDTYRILTEGSPAACARLPTLDANGAVAVYRMANTDLTPLTGSNFVQVYDNSNTALAPTTTFSGVVNELATVGNQMATITPQIARVNSLVIYDSTVSAVVGGTNTTFDLATTAPDRRYNDYLACVYDVSNGDDAQCEWVVSWTDLNNRMQLQVPIDFTVVPGDKVRIMFTQRAF